jgi:MiaB/RimO family radical SAM methylthiotransferase
MKVYLESNCCTRRTSEIVKLNKYFILNDYKIINHPEDADYIVLSTCAFKEQEENYSLSRLRYLKRFPGKLLVLGCLPDIAPSKFSEFTGISSIAPKEIEKIDSFFPSAIIKYSQIEDTNIIPEKMTVTSLRTVVQKLKNDFELSSTLGLRIMRYLGKKSRVILRLNVPKFYLHISKGCLGNCSYCAIRRAIGTIVSQPIDGIVRQFYNGLERGYKDFIVLGDDVGAYGRDYGQTFPNLISRLVDELGSMTNNESGNSSHLADVGFHIQEIHPKWLILYKETFLNLIKSKKIKSILCPIESGNDRILDLMNRRYNVDEILEFFQKARSIYSDITLSTHVMVGFPSETDEEFEDSLRIVTKIHFDNVTIFPYDQKEGTPASKITPQVDDRTIQRRLHKAQQYFKREGIKTFLSCPD